VEEGEGDEEEEREEVEVSLDSILFIKTLLALSSCCVFFTSLS
jgi:hypothetical protein